LTVRTLDTTLWLASNAGVGGNIYEEEEMGRMNAKAAVVVLSAAALIAAPGALAASPQTIYRDYADNGRLDGNYSKQDLQRALQNAAVQAYGSGGQTGMKPAVEGQANGGSSPTTGTDGAAGGTAPNAVKVSGGLPFTGLDLSLIVVGAFGLVLLGGALRRFGRQRS